jgi:hypothetical protein
MSYIKRLHGPRGYRHDPGDQGIFIHGGTCLMHGPGESFRTSIAPNNFSITWPILNGEYPFEHPIPYNSLKTFKQALDLARRIREVRPEIQHCPIYACTDLIKDKPWSGRYEVQLLSPRMIRRKSAVKPAFQKAA